MDQFWKPIPLLALATAILLLIAGAALVIYSEHAYRIQKTEQVTVEAQILASTVSAALTFDDAKAATQYVDALHVNSQIRIAAIYDAKGKLFAHYTTADGLTPPPIAPPLGTGFTDGNLAVAVPVAHDHAVLGTVYVQTATEPFDRRLARYGVIFLLVTMAALVFIVLGIAQATLARKNAELAANANELADANLKLATQIAEREKAEAALWQAQKMEAIGQLTGGIAHDFNNMLQVILGNLSIVVMRLESNQTGAGAGQLQRMVQAAIRGGERAAALTQRLLAFARRQPLVPRPIDVNRLVSNMADMFPHTLGEAIEIKTVLAAGLCQTLVDGNQLENALLNLVVNARDAMPNGGKLTIETANAYLDERSAAAGEDVKSGQYVSIAVTDNGCGMPADVLRNAFDPFFTTKNPGQGTGLGLSQVYGFVKQSGGHARIYSEPGQGTTVKIYLPRIGTGDMAGEEEPHPVAAPSGQEAELILVVEDDAEVRAFTTATLRQLGYRVTEAGDGPTALRALEAAPDVRLLFTDVGLPGGMNGRQLAEEAVRQRPALRVLYTTGYARNAIVHHGRLDPGVELIAKPFTYAALAAKVRTVLERP